ncbi:hypothetical protein PICMEDRAFT_74302 [Pichia membranifaciens NRRL Y-2026]|uniref:Dystroglycan-type cadherin-like domain-containing protein n=1 Tax=Pichia membranifaciens NRRL Y-2026 TaxID=763406 RepID=A0A1E3NGV0_9ASCO|nr:hypothetical protein PICMEDRAFT_74302 [Pichia membranifaciens NRRL Y-2026]ODQ44573.1 hypothetical protein PICMEDRAFT_74302 [Pichia membranifaciens NRRL Y-2026]
MSIGILFLLLLRLSATQAHPSVGFPLNEQLPDIARIGENYQFVINSQTFESDKGEAIQYQAHGLPDWLSFDSSSLKLSGSPTGNDTTGQVDFVLEGTDSEGSLNKSCSIYLSDQPAPVINANETIIDQLQKMGTTNGYKGIILKAQDTFSFKFDSDTFQLPSSSSNKIVAYYGKSANRTSLPSWCFFDADTLTFSGTAPFVNSVNAPSLQFDLTLIATDYAGYSAAYSDFNIVVGGHELFLNASGGFDNIVNTNPGDTFSAELPIEDVYLDDKQIETNQISNVVVYNGPSWVHVENNTQLTGTVPSDQTSNVVVNVTLFDTYGDSLFMDFDINVVHEIFAVDSLSNVTVSDGSLFQYTLPDSYFKNKTATDLDAVFSDTWLTFYHSNNTFVGKVPDDFKSTVIELDASMNSMKQVKKFYLTGKPKISSSSSSRMSSSKMSSSSRNSSSSKIPSSSKISSSRYSSSTLSSSSTMSSYRSASSSATAAFSSSYSAASATSSLSPFLNQNKNSDADTKKKLAIGLGVAIPIVAILSALLLFFCCCAKNRKKNQGEEGGDNDKPSGSGALYLMKEQGSSNATVTSARVLAEKNLTNLEKDSDASSYYSVAQSTLTDGSNHNLYQAAKQQASTDQLLTDPNSSTSNNNSGIFNSWRRSSNGNLKTRDSLGSLATVATNELLTVNMINEAKLRKSQMIYPKMSKLRNINNSTDSMFNGEGTDLLAANNSLATLREEVNKNPISRDGSSQTISSSEAQLVGFNDSGSVARKIQREKKSCQGELYNIGDDDDFGDNISN